MEATSVRQLDLTVKDCTVQNFEGKGMYITNGQKLTVEGCTFNNVRGSQETINYGDHAIDLCIGGVENAEIRIVGNTFVGMSGQNTCIQIQQRNPNGSTDDNPGDGGDSMWIHPSRARTSQATTSPSPNPPPT